MWRLSRSERLCPQNPHIPMFVTAPVLEYPPVVTRSRCEYVTPASAVTYAHASPVVEYLTPARTVACATPARTAATTVFPTAMMSCPLQWLWHAKPTLWMCSVIYWTRPRPSSTTLAMPSQSLLRISRCTSSLLRTSLHNSTGLSRKRRRTWLNSRRR